MKKYGRVLKNINRAGVKFSVQPSHSRDIGSTLSEFNNRSDRLPAELWSHVEFVASSEAYTDILREEEVRLSALNIAFNTGGSSCTRDWEIDWSLHIAEDLDIDSMEEGRRTVKDTLDSMESVQNN